jgi:hypothetical protein
MRDAPPSGDRIPNRRCLNKAYTHSKFHGREGGWGYLTRVRTAIVDLSDEK